MSRHEVGPQTSMVDLADKSQYPRIAASMKKLRSKYSATQNQVFQIPLKEIFTKSLGSIGIITEFGTLLSSADFRVAVSMKVGDRKFTVIGDFSHTCELAETSAINKAVLHLRQSESLGIVDICHRKQQNLICIGGPLYMKHISASRLMESILWKWKNCVDILSSIEKFAQKYISGNCPENKMARSVCHTMMLVRSDAAAMINSLEQQMYALRSERDSYIGAQIESQPMSPRNHAYYPEVDALELFLHWLGLGNCHYSDHITENGLYTAAVHLYLSAHEICIEAKEHKNTISEARNAAALEGIFYLERCFNVEVVGCNHTECVHRDQLNFVYKGLSDEFVSLAATMLHFYEVTIVKVNDLLKYFKGSGMATGTEVTRALIRRIEVAIAECTRSFNFARDKLDTLN